MSYPKFRNLHKVPLSEDQTFKDLVSEHRSLLRPLKVVEILCQLSYKRLHVPVCWLLYWGVRCLQLQPRIGSHLGGRLPSSFAGSAYACENSGLQNLKFN